MRNVQARMRGVKNQDEGVGLDGSLYSLISFQFHQHLTSRSVV